MLRKCSSVMLITDVESYSDFFQEICDKADIKLHSVFMWNSNYRLKEDLIFCGSKFLCDISESYYPYTVVILKPEEDFKPLIEMGIRKFIFTFNNVNEILYSFLTENKVENDSLHDLLKEVENKKFVTDKYSFDFESNRFLYNGYGIYLRKAEKLYLAKWLLLKKKDNSKRNILYNIRHRLDGEFLKDINRFGEVKYE